MEDKAPDSPAELPTGTVLTIGPDRVELFHSPRKGEPIYASSELEDPAPAAVARKAFRLLREKGLRPGPCQLVVTDGMAADRIVSVPSLSAKELRRVLHRKAANLIEHSESQTHFAAVSLRDSLEKNRNAEQRWMVIAVSHGSMGSLGAHLRKRGFRVKEASWERLTLLGALPEEQFTGKPRAALVVGVEARAISLTLMHGADLVHQATLTGNLEEEPGLATVLIQEMRGLEAYWRKISRGRQLADVVLVGVGSETIDSIEPALRVAMPDVRIQRYEPTGLTARANVLATALHAHPFRYDISVPQPVRKPLLTATVALSVLAAGYLGFDRVEVLSARAERLEKEARDLAAEMRDYSQVEANYRRIQDTLQELESERARAAAIGSLGIPLEDALTQALDAFHGHGALMSLNCDGVDRGQTVSITGTTVSEPRSSLVALQGLIDRLGQSSVYADALLVPPSNVTETEGEGEVPQKLEFAVHARWRNL